MKLDSKKNIKRLVIYFFYDEDGIVDRYVEYMLEEMKKNASEIFIVCNGKLNSEGREKLSHLAGSSNVMVRENKGFDVWAYKEALEHYGWKKLEDFDEVVLMNHTIMGPIYPFSEMFEAMNKKDLDFWGLNMFHKVMSNPFNIEYGYIPTHLQSHFIVVRNSLIRSTEFQSYWDNRPPINNYSDAVGKHEAIFTKRFENMGFKWAAYVDTSDMQDVTYYPLQYTPVEVMKKYRCPIFKRRSFFNNYSDNLSYSHGCQAREIMDFLKNETNYDVGMIWENILRTYNMYQIKNCLQLNYIINEKSGEPVSKKIKLALMIHCYFEDLIDTVYDYALSMPEHSDIYITTDSEKKAELIEKKFDGGPWNSVKVILIENRGRDVSALLIGVAEYLDKYDYVCFAHDKKVTQLDCGIKGAEFSKRCFENILSTKQLVNNIIRKFEEEPYLGLLCPPPVNIAEYYSTMGCEWSYNFDNTKEVAKKLELHCHMDINLPPVAPFGTMFWFRPCALKKLTGYKWKYSDFPKEPNNTDGTILHAIERIYPFVAQDAGYYTAWVLSDYYARTEWNNLFYMLREVNVRAFQGYGINAFQNLIYTMDCCNSSESSNMLDRNCRKIVKEYLKKKIPKPIWSLCKGIYKLFGGKKWIG